MFDINNTKFPSYNIYLYRQDADSFTFSRVARNVEMAALKPTLDNLAKEHGVRTTDFEWINVEEDPYIKHEDH